VTSSEARETRLLSGVLAAILAAAAALYAVFIVRTAFRLAGITYFTLIDDAMVSMRYAQHLAGGSGLVWNVGQPPVEGFTNPVWMLIMTVCHLLPIPASKVSLAMMLISALILLTNVVVVREICRVLQPASPLTPLLAAGLTAFYFPLVFWSLRGMEVGLLVLLIDTALLLVLQGGEDRRSAILLGCMLALAVLTRMDALVQVLIMLGYLAVWRVRRSSFLTPLAMVLVALVALLVFQRLYFGDFLPNTYYQKMAGGVPWGRVRNGLLVFYQHALWDTALPASISLAGLLFYKSLRRPQTYLLAALFIVQCAYSVWVGGDYAEPELDSANRFITQGMPALIILFSLSVERFLADRRLPLGDSAAARSVFAGALAVVTLAVMSGRPWLAWAQENAPLLQADVRRARLGLVIARNTAPEAVIAVHAAGQIPYYSGRTTIDLLGLNDPVVAKGPVSGPFYPGHDKWNYQYSILRLRPDLVADNWIKLRAFMQQQQEYIRLDNGMYLRRDSTLVDVPALLRETR
jgi:hypothetical protein